MKLTRSINPKGQVSLEAIILWAGFAAVIALLIPVFTGLVHAQSARVDVENVRSFSHSLASTLNHFSFLASGSRETVSIPVKENLTIEVEGSVVLLSYFSDGMKSPFEEEISSSVELSYESSSESNQLTLIRTLNGITIQFAETFLP